MLWLSDLVLKAQLQQLVKGYRHGSRKPGNAHSQPGTLSLGHGDGGNDPCAKRCCDEGTEPVLFLLLIHGRVTKCVLDSHQPITSLRAIWDKRLEPKPRLNLRQISSHLTQRKITIRHGVGRSLVNRDERGRNCCRVRYVRWGRSREVLFQSLGHMFCGVAVKRI